MSGPDLLRQKTLLLLKRDREYLALQQRFARAAGWLDTGERLAGCAAGGDAAALEAEWPAALVERLQFQCAMLAEPRRGGLSVRASAGSVPPGDPEAMEAARRLVRSHPAGLHNGDGEHPLARLLGLRRFLWATVEHPQAGPVLAVAGFGERTWQFFPPLVAEDLAYYRMTCRQLEALGGQLASIAGLTSVNEALHERTAELGDALAALEAAQAALVEREKLAAVGALAAGVAHEINNPASYVLSNLGALRAELAARPELGGELADLAQDALEGIRRVVELTRELTVFGRPEREVAGERVDLAEVLVAAERRARERLRHPAAVRLEIDGPAVVAGHRARLEQALLTLLLRGLEAGPAPGRAGRTATLRCRRAGASVEVVVLDDGAPIAAGDLPHLFEPSYTCGARGAGLRLGLARDTILRHGGTLEVRSAPGEGTCFTVTLPAAEPLPRALSAG